MSTELVIRIDLGDIVKEMEKKEPEIVEKKVVPTGYRCQSCWAGDGGHEDSCEFKNVMANNAA